MAVGAALGSNCLLFALVFGMSATVDIASLKKQLTNKSALLTGVLLQFVLLPFLGFVVVKALNMPPAMGITLLVVTSSPGGSYSNWYVKNRTTSVTNNLGYSKPTPCTAHFFCV
jgi:predicted Na+-dependent transporter